MKVNPSVDAASPLTDRFPVLIRRDSTIVPLRPLWKTAAGKRAGERIYEVPVASVHAVYGAPEERCWVERRQVEERSGANIPGAVVGGVIGGILGHQVGSGRGKDVATAGGAVAGAAIGANVGRGSEVGE